MFDGNYQSYLFWFQMFQLVFFFDFHAKMFYFDPWLMRYFKITDPCELEMRILSLKFHRTIWQKKYCCAV